MKNIKRFGLMPLLAIIFASASAFTTANGNFHQQSQTSMGFTVYAEYPGTTTVNYSIASFEALGWIIGYEPSFPMDLELDFPNAVCTAASTVCMVEIWNDSTIWDIKTGDYTEL